MFGAVELMVPTTATVAKVVDVVEAVIIGEWGALSPARLSGRTVEAAKIVGAGSLARRVLVVATIGIWARVMPANRRSEIDRAVFVVRDEWGGVSLRTSGSHVQIQYAVLTGVVEYLHRRQLVTDVDREALVAHVQAM
jgi:hypothetical protein